MSRADNPLKGPRRVNIPVTPHSVKLVSIISIFLLAACQSASLVSLPNNKKQDTFPVPHLPSTDPEGRVVEAKEQLETGKKAKAETVRAATLPNREVFAAFPTVPVKRPPGLIKLRRPEKMKHKIGILLPLSGHRKLLGRELLDAAQIAVFDLADEDFIIFPFDTKGTESGAAAAAEEAVRLGVDLILGPLLANSVRAVRPVAASFGVSVVAFSNSHEVAGDGVFILGFVPQQQVNAIVDYAVEKGLYRYAVLAPNDAYGREVVASLKRASAKREAEIVRLEYYDPAATDFSQPAKAIADYDRRHKALLERRAELKARDDQNSKRALKKLEKLDTLGDVDFDAVLLPGRGQQLKAIASLLSFYDVDQPAVRLLGLSNWAQTANIETEPSLNLSWYAAPPRDEREKFFRRYREYYGRPPAAIASLAYDATALAIVLAKSQPGLAFSRKRLLQPYGFLGVDGLFRLRSEGVAERVFEIREVTRKGFRIKRPALTTFPKVGR